jgi:signal transduction histidine kinase
MQARALLQSRLLNEPALALGVAAALAVAISAIDYLTDYELRFGVLYLPPVFLATWGAGRGPGLAIALAAAAVWINTLFVKHPYEDAFVHLWEGGLHLAMYVAFVLVIARLKEVLHLAEERFVSAFDSLDAAACVVDPTSGALLYFNPPFRRAFGEAVVDATTFAARFGGALPEGDAFDLGSGRWYYVLGRAMRWLDGRSVRLQVATDITDTKRAEQLARQHHEQLQRTARLLAVGEMASTLAHELNQPLGAIANYNSGCIRLLRSGNPDTPRLLELMERCSAQALRAGEVVRRIREFVRRQPPALRPHDAGELLAAALAAAQSEAPEATAQLRVEVEPGLPRLAADGMMIEKVMLNLARNALDSMEGIPAADRRVLVRAVGREGAVEFQFRDNGCGVPEELEDRLFHPFLTTKAEGMGLGLAICRSIIEYHRGEMWFTRNPEGGSTFHFTVPAAAHD